MKNPSYTKTQVEAQTQITINHSETQQNLKQNQVIQKHNHQ